MMDLINLSIIVTRVFQSAINYLKTLSTHLLLSTVLWLCVGNLHAATHWESLSPGLEYTVLTPDLSRPYAKLHAFEIDLKYYQFELKFAKDQQQQSTMVKDLAIANQAIIATNGGFFNQKWQPLGLRINKKAIYNFFKPISWWGIFYIQDHQPYIIPPHTFYNKLIVESDFAIQAGPPLLIAGTSPPLTGKLAERTAVCITADKKVILMATENLPLTTNQLATILSRSQVNNGLNCQDALNLDGGHSTQLYANIGNLRLSIANLSPITDAIIVVPRTDS